MKTPQGGDKRQRRWWRYTRAVLLGIVLGMMAEWTLEAGPAFPNAAERTIDFDWDSRTGFKSFHVDGFMGPIIAVETKRRLASCLQQGGWRSARGWTEVSVFPIIVPIAFSPCTGAGKIEDPEKPPLMHAADKSDLDSIQRLLAVGADINARDQAGRTALIHACVQPSVTPSVVTALLRAGADVNAADKFGEACLSLVVSSVGEVEESVQQKGPYRSTGPVLRVVIQELLAANANVNQERPQAPPDIRTPFLQVVMMGDAELVRAMLATGANLKRDGAVALATAESKGYVDVVKLLRSAGATD